MLGRRQFPGVTGAATLAAQGTKVRLEEAGRWLKLTSPQQFAAFTASKKDRWGSIVRRANIGLD